jgi:hypothetical protein
VTLHIPIFALLIRSQQLQPTMMHPNAEKMASLTTIAVPLEVRNHALIITLSRGHTMFATKEKSGKLTATSAELTLNRTTINLSALKTEKLTATVVPKIKNLKP